MTTERSIGGRPPYKRPPRKNKPYTPIDKPTTGPLGGNVKLNPNKARKPSSNIPVFVGVVNERIDGPEIDPSFTSAHGRPTDVGSSATRKPETNSRLDYQGWYTEGDTIPPQPTTSTSRISFRDVQLDFTPEIKVFYMLCERC